MRTVRCVSPHGGAHHGLRADNEQAAPPGYSGQLLLPPNEGGWVTNNVLGHVPVGAEVDAPDAPEFIADGFHFIDAASGQGDVCAAAGDDCWCGQHRTAAADTPPEAVTAAATPPPAPGTSTITDLLGKGDN